MGPNNFNDQQQAILYLLTKYERFFEHQSVFLEANEYHQIIDYYEKEYMMNQALEAVEFAILQYPYTADFLIRKAGILIVMQKETYAMAALDKAEMYAPGDRTISLFRSEALTSLELFDDALAILEEMKLLASPKELSDVLLYEALVYEGMEKYEQMFITLQKALSKNPKNKEALEKLWFCVELSKKYKESIKLHEIILEEDPYSALAWYNLGAAYAYYGDYFEAIEAYEYAYLIDEKFEFAYRECAEICFEVKQYHKALKCYQEVLEHFEPDQDIFLRIGQCYQYQNNHAIAKTFYEKAGQLDPYNDEVWYHMGECYAHHRHWKKAISFFEKAIQLEERREEYFSALGNAYFQVGAHERAEPLLKKATEIAPEESKYWLDYAKFLMVNEQLEAAIAILKEADVYSIDTRFMYYKSVCLFQMGRRKEALIILGDALYEDFDRHDSIFNMMPNLTKDTEVKAIIATFQPI